jgi:hypothetical protein
MPDYIFPSATPECPFPKPVRSKRNAGSFRPKKPIPATDNSAPLSSPSCPAITAHDKLLYECIDVLQQGYPEYSFLHIPNELYGLIGAVPGNELFWVLEKGLGRAKSVQVKKILADAFKGVPDLIVFAPGGTAAGVRASMMGEVKVGSDRIRRPQRQWARGYLLEWRTVEQFQEDMQAFALRSS